jgi:carbon monoxide dehydrogenase subunit G
MDLSFKVRKSTAYIFNYLTDMQKFVSAHPVITKINRKTDNSYLVYETLKLGSIPISFTYPVTITPYPQKNIVVMQAIVMRLTKIDMTFTLKAASDCTIVKETILFRSPLPIKTIMQSIFKKQHTQLFKNIEALNH